MRLLNERRVARPGFTLIELLIVMMVILLLAGLLTGAVMKIRGLGPATFTRANLRSLKSKLDGQWKAVRDKALTEPMDRLPAQNQTWLLNMTPTTTSLADRQTRAKYVIQRLRRAFPDNFADAVQPASASNPLPPLPQ